MNSTAPTSEDLPEVPPASPWAQRTPPPPPFAPPRPAPATVDPWALPGTRTSVPFPTDGAPTAFVESTRRWPSLNPAPEPLPRTPSHLFGGSRMAARRLRLTGGLAAFALVAGAAGGALALALTDDGDPTVSTAFGPAAGSRSSSGRTAAAPSSVLSGSGLDVAGVVAAVEPATVSIEVSFSASPFGGASGAGTGVILTADGDVLTNAHVVDGAGQIRVTLAGESQSRSARLIGEDVGADLALIHIDGASNLPTAQIGSSSQVRVGDDVVAIGNALGLKGGPTVTRGIISALDRSLETSESAQTGLIQTDASISSGNSGGPLVNALGQVIGINTAVATGDRSSSAENIGFAIPTDKALPVVERLRSGTAAGALAYLGVRTSDPVDGSRGATVVTVDAGTPAANGGIEVGDLITHISGKVVAGAAELGGVVQEHEPGEQVEVKVIRNGKEVTLPITLGTRP